MFKKFWCTQDKNEVDFVVKNRVFEIKFDAKRVRRGKYAKFKEQYLEIKLEFLTEDLMLKKFYGLAVNSILLPKAFR